MAEGVEVAKAFVTIAPSIQGAQRQVEKAIVPATQSAGTTAGKKGGAALGSSMAGTLKSHAKAIGAALSVAAVTKFAKTCTTSFQSLAGQTKSLQRVMGGTAKEVSGMSGAMKLAGMDTSKASTSLTKFSKYVSSAATGTESAQETFKQLGISLKDSDGNLKSTSNLLEEAADKFSGMEDGATKTALATTLFGKSGTAMLPFLNKGSAGIDELKKKAEDLGIVLDDQSMTKFGEYKSAVNTWQTALQGAEVTIGESLTPFITMATGALTTALVPAIQGASSTLSSFLDALSSGIDTDSFATAFASISNVFDSVFGSDGGNSAAGFGSALADVINGLAPVLQGLAPIIQSVADTFKQLQPQIASVLSTVGDALTPIIPTISDIVTKLGCVASVAISIGQAVLPVVISAIGNMVTAVDLVLGAITDAVDFVGSLPSTVEGVASDVSGTVSGAIEGIVGYFGGIAGSIGSALSPVTSTVSSVFDGIGKIISAPLTNAKGLVKLACNGIKGAFSVFSSIKGTVSGIFNGVKTAITKPLDTARNLVKGAISKISGIINGAKLSLPHFKLPHFNINGGKLPWGIGGKGKAPSISVDWYAKGGVFDSAQVIGIGEAGREAALPLNNRTYSEIAKGITDQGATTNSVVINLNYSADADANQMVRDIAAGLRRLQMTGA